MDGGAAPSPVHRARGPVARVPAGRSALMGSGTVEDTDHVTTLEEQEATDMAKAYILIHTAAGVAGDVQDRVRSLPGVLAADLVQGAYDLIAEVWGRSQHDIRADVVTAIEAQQGVLRAIACPVGSHAHLWEEILEPAYSA